jgi:hypothetical protein
MFPDTFDFVFGRCNCEVKCQKTSPSTKPKHFRNRIQRVPLGPGFARSGEGVEAEGVGLCPFERACLTEMQFAIEGIPGEWGGVSQLD